MWVLSWALCCPLRSNLNVFKIRSMKIMITFWCSRRQLLGICSVWYICDYISLWYGTWKQGHAVSMELPFPSRNVLILFCRKFFYALHTRDMFYLFGRKRERLYPPSLVAEDTRSCDSRSTISETLNNWCRFREFRFQVYSQHSVSLCTALL